MYAKIYRDLKIEAVEKFIKGIKLNNIEDPMNTTQNSKVALFWVSFLISPKLFFLGTRFNNSPKQKADIFQLYSMDDTPCIRF